MRWIAAIMVAVAMLAMFGCTYRVEMHTCGGCECCKCCKCCDTCDTCPKPE